MKNAIIVARIFSSRFVAPERKSSFPDLDGLSATLKLGSRISTFGIARHP